MRQRRTLQQAEAVEPENPVVVANRGVVLSDSGRPPESIPLFRASADARPRLQRGALQSRAGAPAGGSANRTRREKRTSCCGGCQRTRRSGARSNGCLKPPAEVANDIGPTQPMLYNAFRPSIRHNPKADWTASKALDLALTPPFVPPSRPSLNRYVLLTCDGAFVPLRAGAVVAPCGRRGSANPSFVIRRQRGMRRIIVTMMLIVLGLAGPLAARSRRPATSPAGSSTPRARPFPA